MSRSRPESEQKVMQEHIKLITKAIQSIKQSLERSLNRTYYFSYFIHLYKKQIPLRKKKCKICSLHVASNKKSMMDHLRSYHINDYESSIRYEQYRQNFARNKRAELKKNEKKICIKSCEDEMISDFMNVSPELMNFATIAYGDFLKNL